MEYLDYKVGKLELREGDVLVVKTDLILSREQCEELRDRVEEQIGARMREMGVKIAIFTADMDLGVLHKEES